jgi:YD repeat-containing protein
VNRLQTSTVGSNTTNYSYDGNGNLITVVEPSGAPYAMSYDNENRLREHRNGSTITTFAYQYDGMKRTESTGASRTTIVWDGSDYLQGRD